MEIDYAALFEEMKSIFLIEFLKNAGMDNNTAEFFKLLVRNGCPVSAIEKTLLEYGKRGNSDED